MVKPIRRLACQMGRRMNIWMFPCPILIFLLLSYSRHNLHAAEQILVASFTTAVTDQTDQVKHNIALACGKLNGVVIPPRDIFSFNDTVGEGSARNGFAPGRVLYRDRVVIEYGGGLCQVSSTLFNALLLAGCTIIERHRHTQPVSYVPLGLDATIKFGKKDLRMKNPHAAALRIEARMNEQSLIIAVTSEKNTPFQYEITTEEEEVTVPVFEEGAAVRQGISVYVYRRRIAGTRLVATELLYRDFYPPAYAGAR